MDSEEKTENNYPEEHGTKRAYPAASKNGGVAGVYGLAFIGAAVYFIGHAATFWAGVLGFLKAIVWPALLVYNVLDFLKM